MTNEYSPNAKRSAFFLEREAYVEPPTGETAKAIRLEDEVSDLERCLKGDATSNRWQELNLELTKKKGALLHMKRRLAGRTPQMESWADPLP